MRLHGLQPEKPRLLAVYASLVFQGITSPRPRRGLVFSQIQAPASQVDFARGAAAPGRIRDLDANRNTSSPS